MIIKSMNVKNFRSILDETLIFDNLTALVGANGSGKSSFLHALELFQSKQPKIIQDDFYYKNIETEIVFAITFTNLSEKAKEQFSKYLQGDELTVERVFRIIDNKPQNAFHGSTLQNPDFSIIKKLNAREAKPKYEILRRLNPYNELPNWDNFENIKNELKNWEETHFEKCERIRDDGQFFGFTEVASGHLDKYIKFLYIPAVRDASEDATEGKNSVLKDLIQIVVRNQLMKKEAVQTFEKEFKEKYEKVLNKENMDEITNLSKSLTKTLNSYVPDAQIDLSWLTMKDFKIDLPSAIAHLVEDGYSATVERAGHGLQRVFIMTLLQHLSTVNNIPNENVEGSENPTLILMIDEPELYQHPNRQRHLSEICVALSEGKVEGVTSKIQVVYSTHSPHFIGLDRINHIRLLRKQVNVDGEPKITKISNTTISKLTEKLSEFHGGRFTETNILPRLHMIRTPLVNEGFFSKCVVLVEGDSDRACILGASNALKINLVSQGISIISCNGKRNLDKVAIIFKQLKIPTYIIWDNDKGKNAEIRINKILLKLCEEEESDFPSHVKDNHAVIEPSLEIMLKNKIGEEKYDNLYKNCVEEYELKSKDANKNPVVLKTMLESLEGSNGTIPDILKQILDKIQQLNNTQ